jgi:hypothetical protein
LIVDAKDDKAVAFYLHHGFTALVGNRRQQIVLLQRFIAAGALRRSPAEVN